jgi:phage-related tail fiber protein
MRVIDGLDLSNQQIRSVADGSAATDAVTLQQLQAYVRGLDWKGSVRAASTADVTVSAPGAMLDGVSLDAVDRVLLKNQASAAENGVYVFNGAASPLTRATDANTGTLSAAMAVLVTEGTANGDTAWVLVTDDPIVVGTTALTFNQFGGATIYTGSDGVDVTANVISVRAVAGGGISIVAGGLELDYTKTTGKFSTSIGDGVATTITVTHGLGVTDVMVTVKDVASGEVRFMGWTVVDANAVSLSFPAAPTSNQFRVTVHG